MEKFVKNYNYEKIFIYNFIFLIISLIFLINVLNKKIPSYEVVKGELVINKIYSIFVDNNTLKQLQKNPYVYVDNNKIKVEVIETYKNYYKNYNKVLIKCDIKKEKKELDISIYKKKKTFLKIFIECWED